MTWEMVTRNMPIFWDESSKAYQKRLGLLTTELGIECYPWNNDTPVTYWCKGRPIFAGSKEELLVKLKRTKPVTKQGRLLLIVEDSETDPVFLLFRHESENVRIYSQTHASPEDE